MPWHRVVHSCSHVDSHDLTGSRRERDRTAAWRSRQPCRRCYKRSLADAAAAWCAAQGLPPLVGRAADRRAGEQARAAVLRPYLECSDVLVLGPWGYVPMEQTTSELMRHASARLRSLAGEVRAWRVQQTATHLDPSVWVNGEPEFVRYLRKGWALEHPARRAWLVAEIAAAHARRSAELAARNLTTNTARDPEVLRLAAGHAEAEVRAVESRVAEATLQARAEARRAAAARRRAVSRITASLSSAVVEPEIPRVSPPAERRRAARTA